MSNTGTLLVTGAAGQLGKLVLDSLLKTAGVRVIATTRDPSKLKEYEGRVTVRAADFTKPDTLSKAFEGAERLLLISTDAVGQRVAQHKAAIDAAVKAGVKHIVYTSWTNPDRSLALVAPEHTETERLIEKSGLSYTILRNAYYADNLLFGLPQAVETGVLAGAQDGGRQTYVTREDCARSAAAALSSKDTVNAVLDITGSKALSNADIAAIVSEIAGKTISALNMPASDFKGGLVNAGFPEPVANLLTSFELAVKQGAASTVTTAVKDLTGQAPTDLKSFLIAHKKSFIK